MIPNGYHPERLADSIYYAIAKGVVFPVNKYDLRSDDPWFRELMEEVKPWSDERHLQLRYLDVRGASSPEGPTEWNDFLADARSRSLQMQLDSLFGISSVPIRVEGHSEDWNALIYLMEQAADPDLATIRRIIDYYSPDRDAIKRRIKNIEAGRLWQRIFNKYFAKLRYARVILYFEEIKMKAVDTLKVEPVRDTIPPADITIVFPPDTISTELPQDDRFPRRHLLALRTNLLYDAFWMPRYGMAPSPNVSLELYPTKGHFTYNVSWLCPDWERWSKHKFWQIQDLNLGVRFYTRRKKKAPRDVADHPLAPTIADRFTGLYIGAYCHANRFGIGFDKDTGWEGEGWGAGMQIGYTVPLCKSYRWRMEFSLGVGYYTCKYDPYVWGNPVSGEVDGLYYYDWHHSADTFIKRNHRFTWIGPTELGIHLTYDILYRRAPKKKGISFNRWSK